jgi:exopolyphosphatase/guanosine-5'-triphosphate,3'-diphosphate pyrophosphatase
MKLAAIDIGSNAIRLQVVKVFEDEDQVSFKKLEYLRFPLRLGKDVFKTGKITTPTIRKFVKLMNAFKLLIDLYEIEGYSAVATSAMREASNGNDIKTIVAERLGLNIDIISGEDEARILNKAIIPYLSDDCHIHIDVGGGSTELNLFLNKKLVDSASFRAGSVRKLTSADSTKTFKEIQAWIKKVKPEKTKNIEAIGTGGNINKLFKLATRTKNNAISLVELKGIRAYVKTFSFQQRTNILKMNPDRADVIIPASQIYIKVMQFMGSNQILVPRVGLKDGLIYELYELVSGKSLAQIEFLQEF